MSFPWTCTKFWFASYRSCFSSVSPENVQYFSWVLDANIVLFKDNRLKPGSFPLWHQALFLTWLCALPPDAKSCVFLTRDRKRISQLAYATRPFTVLFLFYLLEAYAVVGGWGWGGELLSWCLMSSDVIWHIRDKLWPMPKHGSIILYVHESCSAFGLYSNVE